MFSRVVFTGYRFASENKSAFVSRERKHSFVTRDNQNYEWNTLYSLSSYLKRRIYKEKTMNPIRTNNKCKFFHILSPMLWHDFDYPNNKLMPSSCKYAFKLKSVSCARLIPSIRIEAQTSICHPTWVRIRSRNCCFRKPGLVWKKANTLFFFFNYTFISAYKIYFFIPYQRYCFGYFVCQLRF